MTKMVLDRVNVLLASGNLPTPDDLSDPNEGGPPSLFHGTLRRESRHKMTLKLPKPITTVKKRVDGERGESMRRCFSRKRQ